ncbi:rhodanese-like domain-containing protein [Allostreptomyces psammosilenae]|uniref:Rhodanese-related sulfurtransferase n=1 Tax=Allostreptomyces psammosilenae TaxID=1892865 RepID=A0A852ZUL6_9ACTN|nr:rhodanese-like domain-containing protein [Allostreptomyces psammosilenae]NYI04464.1 rhodanese-related sulfurtransferase [Allostreptomyces psammosilenae]
MTGTSGVDRMLARARARITRLTPGEAADALAAGARLVDIRPAEQRAREGAFPADTLVIERNVLEWRLDPTCAARLPEAVDHDVRWIIACSEGYTSSLAAASLRDLGLRHAADLAGGFHAWRRAGLPTTPPTAAGAPAD